MSEVRSAANDHSYQPPRLGVFPLPLFILPQGRHRLKIYEPDYLAMIARATREEGFIIAALNNAHQQTTSRYGDDDVRGCRVSIIDFHSDEHGILMVDVEGVSLVSLKNIEHSSDGLLTAEPVELHHWTDSEADYLPCHDDSLSSDRKDWSMLEYAGSESALKESLRKIVVSQPTLAELYPSAHYESTEWVCARLIEILPVPYNVKARFTTPDSLPSLFRFLVSFLEGK